MRRIFISCLMAVGVYAGHSQVITVRDAGTNERLEFVTIASNSPHTFEMTNARGQADVSAFQNSKKIEFRIVGYETGSLSFDSLQKAGFEVRLRPSEISLDQVIVSATRWSQSGQDVPARVISVTPKDISLQNPQTTADLLGATGEVYIQKSQQGGGSPMIRGFSTNRLLYTVDGVRMNTAIFRSGNLQNVISLDPFTMESAEVMFGPGSMIYGSDAIGGVMSFRTLTPQMSVNDKPLISGKATGRVATANLEKTVHGDINFGWKKWASVTSITGTDFDDLKMGKHGPDEYLRRNYVQRKYSIDFIIENEDPRLQVPTGYAQLNLMEKIRYRPNEGWDFQYGFHYATTTDFPRYDRLIRFSNGEPKSAEWKYGPQVWMMNNLNIHYNTGSKWFDQATLRLAHQYFEESRIDRDFGDDIRSTRTEQVNAFSANLDFTKSLAPKTRLYYGMEAVVDDVDSKGEATNITSDETMTIDARYPLATWSSYAGYATFQHSLSERFLIQTGLRYSLFSLDADFSGNLDFFPLPETQANINNSAVTGSLGIVYHSRTWTASANASSGFRAPNVDDIGKVFDSEPGTVTVPNPDLQAEHAYNGEISIAKVLGEVVKLDLTAYYTLLNNAMVRRNFTLNGQDSIVYDGELSGVQAVQNAARAHVYGVQAGLEIQLPAGLGLSSQYNYQKGEEETDDGTISPSRHAAPAFGMTKISWSNANLKLQLYAVYNADKSYNELPEEEKGKDYIYATDKDGNPWSPGWYTFNLKGSCQFNKAINLGFGLENITDQRYRPYSSGIVAPGRNFMVSLGVKF